MNQPSSNLYKLKKKIKLTNADEIEKRGFFIGLHTKKISNQALRNLCENLLKIEKL